MGYVTKWLIIEEFSIILNYRILSEKWVGMLRIIQAERINSTIKNEIFSGRDFHSLRGAPRRVNQGCRLLQQRETAHEYWYDDARGSFNIYRG